MACSGLSGTGWSLSEFDDVLRFGESVSVMFGLGVGGSGSDGIDFGEILHLVWIQCMNDDIGCEITFPVPLWSGRKTVLPIGKVSRALALWRESKFRFWRSFRCAFCWMTLAVSSNLDGVVPPLLALLF